MPDRVKTSFIPKQSLKTERTASVRQTTYGVVNTIAAVVLIAAIIGAVGLFFFEGYVKSSISSKRESLDRARAAFQPETIKELSRLDTRLSVGNTLLSQHIAPSRLFDFLEAQTLTSVRFSSFTYGESGPGRIMLSMDGEAESFNAVALQSDAFGESGMFSEVIFENLNINSVGNVVFKFSAVVNPSQLAYNANRTVNTTPAPTVVPDESDATVPQGGEVPEGSNPDDI